jgi:hypothetical protein
MVAEGVLGFAAAEKARHNKSVAAIERIKNPFFFTVFLLVRIRRGRRH